MLTSGGLQRARPRVPKSFAGVHPFDYLLRRSIPLVGESRAQKRILDKVAYLNSLVYLGKRRVLWSAKNNCYYEVPGQNEPTSQYHSENYYQFLTKSNVKEYLKSTPSIRARAAELEDEAAEKAAQIAEAARDDFARRFRTTASRAIEYRRVQLGGNFAVYLDWDPRAGEQLEMPVYVSEQYKPAPDSLTCYNCGLEVTGDAGPPPGEPPGALAGAPADLSPDPLAGAPPGAAQDATADADTSQEMPAQSPESVMPLAPPAMPPGMGGTMPGGLPPDVATAAAPQQRQLGIPPAPSSGAPVPCPRCGSTATDVVRVSTATRTTQVGSVSAPTGDWVVRSVPVLELTVNSAARDHFELTDVSWLRWCYTQPRSTVECDYPDIELPGGDGAYDDEQRGLRYERYLEQSLGGMELSDWIPSSPRRDELVIVEDWYTPQAIAEYEVAVGDSWDIIVDGQPVTLTEGQHLTDVCPNGVQFKCTGGLALECNSKPIRKHWQWFGFDPNPESFYYLGTETAVALQYELDEVHSYLKTCVMTCSMPTTVVRGGYLPDLGLSSNPSKIMRTSEDMPDEMALRSVMEQYPPQDPGQAGYELRDKIKEAMEYATGALNNFNGVDSARDRTATQTSILQASSLAHAEAVMMGLAECEARLDRLAVSIWRKNGNLPRAFECKSDYAESEMVEFAGTDLVTEIDFVVEPGTVLPRRPYQERDDFEQFIKMTVDYKAQTGGQDMPTTLQSYAANVYGLSTLLVDAKKAERVAMREIKALKAVAAQGQGIVAQISQQKLQQLDAIPDQMPPQPGASPDEQEPQAEAASESPGDETGEPQAGAPGAQQPSPDAQQGPPQQGPDPRVLKVQAAQALAEAAQSPEGQAAMILEWISTNPSAPMEAKVRMQADDHMAIKDFLKRYLQGDRGMKESPLVTALLLGRISEHIAAWGAQMAEETAAKLVAQGPMLQMQAAQAQQAAAMQAPPPGAQEAPAKGAARDAQASKKAAQSDAPATPKEFVHTANR